MINDICASLATSFLNIDSSRVSHPSLHERKKGFTEIWGLHESPPTHNNDSNVDDNQHDTNLDIQIPPRLILTQYKISHLEQLYLRIFHIPHLVRNSPYICTEGTGPLPYLTDVTCGAHTHAHTQTRDKGAHFPPALIGRHHPKHDIHLTTDIKSENSEDSNDSNQQKHSKLRNELYNQIQSFANPIHMHDASDIITYLRISHHECTLPQPQANNDEDADNASSLFLYESLILETLQPILEYLQVQPSNIMKDANAQLAYEANCHSNQTYFKKQNHSNVYFKNNALLHPFAAFQYWASESISKRDSRWWWNKSSINSNCSQNKDESGFFINGQNWSRKSATEQEIKQKSKLLSIAKQGYMTLENALSFTSSNKHHLSFLNVEHTKPCHLDVLLYSHLCEAIMNPDLIVLLSACPTLLKFLQNIYERYFGEEYTGFEKNEITNLQTAWWVQQNNRINQINAYHPKWMLYNFKKKSQPYLYDLAKEMAANLSSPSSSSLFDSNYDDDNVDEIQIDEYIKLLSTSHFRSNPANAFHRLRLGGTLYPKIDPSKSKDKTYYSDETFEGYLSFNYLKSNERWYSRFLSQESFDSASDGNTRHQNQHDSSRKAEDDWIETQKKLKTQNDEKWMIFVIGLVSMTFMFTSFDLPASE